jgi:hypothetical protein
MDPFERDVISKEESREKSTELTTFWGELSLNWCRKEQANSDFMLP